MEVISRIQYSRSRTFLCIWVIMSRNSVAFGKSPASFAQLPMKKTEEDYEYGRINDTQVQSTLVRGDRNYSWNVLNLTLCNALACVNNCILAILHLVSISLVFKYFWKATKHGRRWPIISEEQPKTLSNLSFLVPFCCIYRCTLWYIYIFDII